MRPRPLFPLATLTPLTPTPALVEGIDLVVVRHPQGDDVSVLYGRCLHRGGMLCDGHIRGDDLVCDLHNWDYRYATGVSAYDPRERLAKFTAWVEEGIVTVDADEIARWGGAHPQPFDREAYLGAYADTGHAPDEPKAPLVRRLAATSPERLGHGPVAAMGVPGATLPQWDDLQIVTAQLHRLPLLDDAPVGTELLVGPRARKPLRLAIPLLVSDLSFGALSEEAKISLATGAERAGTGICSGEGGSLDEERHANRRYFYELASARFGFSMAKVKEAAAFHFKMGQSAKTGVGGHLPGKKVTGRIAATRGLPEGVDAISPSRFPDWERGERMKDFADEVREATGGIPIGVKMSAQSVEKDIDAALALGIDYLILDGRGGGTGAAPTIIRDHIGVPTIPALARARRHLARLGCDDVTLIVTGGLRTPADFVKALALGADGIALSTAAMMAIGCQNMRACHTNKCPVGIATQEPHLRARLDIERSARGLARFFANSVALMQTLARACGHDHLNRFSPADLTAWKKEMAELAGVSWAGPEAP